MGQTFVNKTARTKNLPIVDATEPLKLEVVARDITGGEQQNTQSCGLARAAERQYALVSATFFRTVALLEYKTKIVRYKLSSSIQKELFAFDRGGRMLPGHYVLSPIPPNARRDARKRKEERSARKHVKTHGKHSKQLYRHVLEDARGLVEP